MQFVECPECAAEFCLTCLKDKHEGITCNEFLVLHGEERGQGERVGSEHDMRFEALMADYSWKRCPACGVPSERVSGCNFMKCQSVVCRTGNEYTFWCYVCGLKLGEDEHYTHYPQGPFQESCNGMHSVCRGPSPQWASPSPPSLPGSPPPAPVQCVADMRLKERRGHAAVAKCMQHGWLCRRGISCPGRRRLAASPRGKQQNRPEIIADLAQPEQLLRRAAGLPTNRCRDNNRARVGYLGGQRHDARA